MDLAQYITLGVRGCGVLMCSAIVCVRVRVCMYFKGGGWVIGVVEAELFAQVQTNVM